MDYGRVDSPSRLPSSQSYLRPRFEDSHTLSDYGIQMNGVDSPSCVECGFLSCLETVMLGPMRNGSSYGLCIIFITRICSFIHDYILWRKLEQIEFDMIQKVSSRIYIGP